MTTYFLWNDVVNPVKKEKMIIVYLRFEMATHYTYMMLPFFPLLFNAFEISYKRYHGSVNTVRENIIRFYQHYQLTK